MPPLRHGVYPRGAGGGVYGVVRRDLRRCLQIWQAGTPLLTRSDGLALRAAFTVQFVMRILRPGGVSLRQPCRKKSTSLMAGISDLCSTLTIFWCFPVECGFFARSRRRRNHAEAWQRHVAQRTPKFNAEIGQKTHPYRRFAASSASSDLSPFISVT